MDAFDKGSSIQIIPAEKKIIGYTTRNSGGVPANFKNYFVIHFDKAFTVTYTTNGTKLVQDSLQVTNAHAGAIVGFKTKRGEKSEPACGQQLHQSRTG